MSGTPPDVVGDCVFEQHFRWHDASGNADYTIGRDQYLAIDASREPAACSCMLTHPIDVDAGGVEVCMRVAARRQYEIRLIDGSGRVALVCSLDEDGWIRARRGDTMIDTGLYQTWHSGVPIADSKVGREWYAIETDCIDYRFDRLNFDTGDVRLTLTYPDHARSAQLTGCIADGTQEITKLELATKMAVPGTLMRVQAVREYLYDIITHEERFTHDWRPWPSPPEGYPLDHICETRLRPVDHRWLETSSFYGWAWAGFPSLTDGEISFEMMVDDVEAESCLQLQQLADNDGFELGAPVQVGIFNGRFVCAVESSEHCTLRDVHRPTSVFHFYDEPIPKPNTIHRLRVRWYSAGFYRLWIDDRAMQISGRTEISMYAPAGFVGVDAVLLHPGLAYQRMTRNETLAGTPMWPDLPRLSEPHKVRWGALRVSRLTPFSPENQQQGTR